MNRVEFATLELQDVGPFGGRQSFSFARPPDDGASALTLVTGGGGSGKSSLAAALRLALWGMDPRVRSDDVPNALRFVNARAIRGPQPQALLRLTLHRPAAAGDGVNTILSRSISVEDDYSVMHTLHLEAASPGEDPHEVPSDQLARAERLLPAGATALVFSSGEQIEDLGGLAYPDRPRRKRALEELTGLTGTRSPDARRGLGPSLIDVGNTLLAMSPEAADLRFEPSSGPATEAPAITIVPGVALSREPADPDTRAYVGLALLLALRAERGLDVPLVLDAPLDRLRLDARVLFLEGLCKVSPSQLILLTHEEQIDHLALSLWERAEWTFLIECHREGRTVLWRECASAM